jgi:hydrogenase nickel incorporation protein HypA/HybF
MHELALAESVVAIASRHAAGRPVARVELKVGHLRQVVPAALEFAFELVAQGTAVEGAQLVLEAVPAAGRCRRCGTESELPGFPLACAACGSVDVELLRGEELLVEALELEEAMNGGAA